MAADVGATAPGAATIMPEPAPGPHPESSGGLSGRAARGYNPAADANGGDGGGETSGGRAMIDIMKKTFATGVGLAVMTRDKVEELGKELARAARLSEQEGSDLIKSLHEHAEGARADLQGRIDREVTRVVERLKLAPREEVDALRARIDELEAKLRAAPDGPG